MLLDELFFIKKKLDDTLLFRHSCRKEICESCAININGINRLASIYKMSNNLQN